MATTQQKESADLVKQELDELEKSPFLLDGKWVKPSQCYRFFMHAPHVLYNTHCPEQLMEKIESILLKYKKE